MRRAQCPSHSPRVVLPIAQTATRRSVRATHERRLTTDRNQRIDASAKIKTALWIRTGERQDARRHEGYGLSLTGRNRPGRAEVSQIAAEGIELCELPLQGVITIFDVDSHRLADVADVTRLKPTVYTRGNLNALGDRRQRLVGRRRRRSRRSSGRRCLGADGQTEQKYIRPAKYADRDRPQRASATAVCFPVGSQSNMHVFTLVIEYSNGHCRYRPDGLSRQLSTKAPGFRTFCRVC